MPKERYSAYYRDPKLTCWSDCPDEYREKCVEQMQVRQVGGEPQPGGVAVIESTRPECEIGGPVYFLGELICGANVDPRDV